MAAYVAGDRAAFRELFDRYAPLLLSLMKRGLDSREDARDLVQQTFLQLHRGRGEFYPSGELRPWLFTIAMNLKRQYFRGLSRRGGQPCELMEVEGESGAGIEVQTEVAWVRSLIEDLPADQRDVIVLHWFEGLPFQAVALTVGASLSAVKVRAHRGYVAMRRIIGQDDRRLTQARLLS